MNDKDRKSGYNFKQNNRIWDTRQRLIKRNKGASATESRRYNKKMQYNVWVFVRVHLKF